MFTPVPLDLNNFVFDARNADRNRNVIILTLKIGCQKELLIIELDVQKRIINYRIALFKKRCFNLDHMPLIIVLQIIPHK